MMNVEAYLVDYPEIFQMKCIESSEIPFSQMVSDACKANQCGRYGTCWTCPPGVGTQEELEKEIRSYKNALVFNCKYELEDWYDFEGMIAGQEHTHNVLSDIARKMRECGEEFLALGCEGCKICERCTYPDAPCRFPHKAIKSVEACGINVVELASKTGLNYNNGANTVTYFCVILFD